MSFTQYVKDVRELHRLERDEIIRSSAYRVALAYLQERYKDDIEERNRRIVSSLGIDPDQYSM